MKIDSSGDEIKIYDFSALEAYKIGRHLEEEGIAFYNSVVKADGNNKLSDSISSLINEEKKHYDILQDKIEKITEQNDDGFEEESIEDFLSSSVFSYLKEIKNGEEVFQDRQKAIEFGIIIENRSISFYEAILKSTEDPGGKDAIKDLIKEEQEHLAKLKTLI